MAKLTIPAKAYAWYGERYVEKVGWVRNTKPGKYHLANPHLSGGNSVHTVCKHLIYLDQTNVVAADIAELDASQLCERCLGSMVAED